MTQKNKVNKPKNQTNNLQKKVSGLYEGIRSNFYLCRDDLAVGDSKYNSALLFGVLTELNKGKQLLFGEYGGGKTTSAEYLHSIFHSLPIDIIRRAVIRGNPQLTQEKIIGRPDYGKMHQGQEDVVWQHFVLIPPKVVDEFNRIPESNQAVLLDGLDRGEWGYLNEHISQGNHAFFATCNYEDRGNNTLIPPILDRFDVATESKFPGVANAVSISYDFHNEKDIMLKDAGTSKKIINLLNSKKPYGEITENLEEISAEFRGILTKRGLETLTRQELSQIDQQIGKVKLDSDAITYLSFLISELNQHPKYGQKRSNDPVSREEGGYLFNLVEGSGSRREDKSVVRYAQALAWLQNQEQANLEHVLTVAPYALWHRLRLTDETINKLREDKRTEPLVLHAVKTLLGDGIDELPGVKKRFVESRENYQGVMNFIAKNESEKALKLAELYSANGKGHPIFLDLMQEFE